jgi:hypothetical protein
MPLNVAEILKKPVEIVQEGYYDIFVPALLPFVVSIVFAIAVGGSVMGMASVGLINVGALIGLVGAYVLAVIITSILATGAIVYMAYQEFNGVRMGYQEGINAAMRKLTPLLIASIVIGIGVAFGMMLLIIPGLLWALFTIFTTPEIMISNKDWLDAIKGSIEVVKQNFRDVLVFTIALLIISAIISIVVGSIPYIGNPLAMLITTTYAGVAVTAAYLELEQKEAVH